MSMYICRTDFRHLYDACRDFNTSDLKIQVIFPAVLHMCCVCQTQMQYCSSLDKTLGNILVVDLSSLEFLRWWKDYITWLYSLFVLCIVHRSCNINVVRHRLPFVGKLFCCCLPPTVTWPFLFCRFMISLRRSNHHIFQETLTRSLAATVIMSEHSQYEFGCGWAGGFVREECFVTLWEKCFVN